MAEARIYISGPMSGLPDFNYPAFEAAAERLRGSGYVPVSPTAIGQHPGWTWERYMKAAVAMQATCDAVYMLNGWETSRGATTERALAHVFGQPVAFEEDADHE